MNFSKIVIKLNGTESNLLILQNPWSIQFDPNRMILTILDSEGNILKKVKVNEVDGRNNLRVICGEDDYLIYVEEDIFYIVRKLTPNETPLNL